MALNSTLDGANIDALMISSATKRDLKKMAKYAFDESGVDCESRNQIKKVLSTFCHSMLDKNSLMKALIDEAKAESRELERSSINANGRRNILEAYTKMVHLYKVALFVIGMNPNASVDEWENTALHKLFCSLNVRDDDIDKRNYLLEILQSFIDCDFHLDQTNRGGETIFEAWYYTSDCPNTIDFLRSAVRKNNLINPHRLGCLAAAAVPEDATECLNRNEINYPEVLIDVIYHHQFFTSHVSYEDEDEDESETEIDRKTSQIKIV